jgi:hypothetical protein
MASSPIADQKVVLGQMAVLSQYGRVMLSIQLFETQLIGAAMLASVGNPHGPPKKVQLKRAFKKILKRAIHLNFKATAAEARASAAKVLPPELMKEVDEAIKWRNRLAHRYLREKLIGSERGEFVPGTYDELLKLTHSFDRLGKRLAKENERIGSAWPDDTPPPPEVAHVLESAMMTLLKGESPPARN